MTADKFSKLAMNIPGASKSAHMGHPDFRLAGKVFATLGYPDKNHGMVKLTPAQQEEFVKLAPDIFSPCNGIWGRRGSTKVHLSSAKAVGLIRVALDAARHNVIKK
jgi:hypothetical protein